MELTGVIPPLHVLNETLLSGGDRGGMSPGTSWKPFRITEDEYQELVESLLSLDFAEAKKYHPYVSFENIIVDETLHHCSTRLEWLKAVSEKYSH